MESIGEAVGSSLLHFIKFSGLEEVKKDLLREDLEEDLTRLERRLKLCLLMFPG